jgi:hypothetical protein
LEISRCSDPATAATNAAATNAAANNAATATGNANAKAKANDSTNKNTNKKTNTANNGQQWPIMANNGHEQKSLHNTTLYLHDCCFSPVQDT